jgi:hypothetical protein
MTDRLLLAYGLIAVILLVGAGLLLAFARRRRNARRTSSRIDVSGGG